MLSIASGANPMQKSSMASDFCPPMTSMISKPAMMQNTKFTRNEIVLTASSLSHLIRHQPQLG